MAGLLLSTCRRSALRPGGALPARVQPLRPFGPAAPFRLHFSVSLARYEQCGLRAPRIEKVLRKPPAEEAEQDFKRKLRRLVALKELSANSERDRAP